MIACGMEATRDAIANQQIVKGRVATRITTEFLLEEIAVLRRGRLEDAAVLQKAVESISVLRSQLDEMFSLYRAIEERVDTTRIDPDVLAMREYERREARYGSENNSREV